MRPIEPGRILGGKYQLRSVIGEGGMGSVWLAEHLLLGSEVAVKVINPAARDKRLNQRFTNEAKAAAALRSPHVVQILDYGVDDDLPFIVMERLEGESLSQRLDREGRLTPEVADKVITHVARALSKAHDAGLVHRDLKPDNVFLVANEDDFIAKVLDFGIVKALGEDRGFVGGQTDTGSVVGSPFYMSPEQAYGGGKVDHRADLWSLGVIAYECLIGTIPFDGEGVGEVMVKICRDPIPVPSHMGPVPVGFDAWFTRALQRDVEDRFQSAREMAAALREVLNPEAAARAQLVSSYDEAGGRVSRPDSGDYGRSDALAPTMAESDGIGRRGVTPMNAGATQSADTLRPPGELARRRRNRLIAYAGGVAVLAAAGVLTALNLSDAPPEDVAPAAASAFEGAQAQPAAAETSIEATRSAEPEVAPSARASAEAEASAASAKLPPPAAAAPKPVARPRPVHPAVRPKPAAPDMDSLLGTRR